MVAPQLWHENVNSPYLRPESCDFDKLQWEVRESAGKTSIWIPGGGALVFTAKALLLGPPSRWNDDPRQALTVRLQGDQLTTWLRDIEDWALPKIVSREEAKTIVKTNVFQETYVRAKLSNATRFYNKNNEQTTQCPEAGEVTCLLSAFVYRMNGLKGLSLRVLAIQG